MNLKDTRQVIALILIGVGVLWLLNVLGAVNSAFITALVRYWPVLLIGVGLDMLLRERRIARVPYAVVALLLIVVASFFVRPDRVRGAQPLVEPLGNAQRAEVELDLGSVPTFLTALGDDDTLLEADTTNRREVRLEVRGDREKRVRLEDRSRRSSRDATLQLRLTPEIPLALNIDAGSGSVDLNLDDIRLSGLGLDLGSGGADVVLPQTGEGYEVDLDGGSGPVQIIFEDGADVTLDADLGSGPSTFVMGEVAYAELELDTGSGNVTFDVPDDANVRLVLEDDDDGNLSLLGWLEPVSGDEDEQVWQTQGFDPAAGQIIIRLDDLGSGGLTVE